MKLEERVGRRLERYRSDPDYRAELLSIGVTEQIARAMDERGVNRTELARRLGVSKARVTNLLGGSTNLTLRTLAAIAVALGCDIELQLGAPRPQRARRMAVADR
ncbi:MAG: helix-turn-helix domain-containing protein [Thermoanaerobaculia bacterium]